MNVCLDAFGSEESKVLSRDSREERVADKIHASNSHVLKSRLCERDRGKVPSRALQNGLGFLHLSSTLWKNQIAFGWRSELVQRRSRVRPNPCRCGSLQAQNAATCPTRCRRGCSAETADI